MAEPQGYAGARLPPIPEGAPTGGFWHHYKGGTYSVIGTGHHAETGEILIFYRNEPEGDYTLADIKFYARPLIMWNEIVAPGVHRFTRLPNAPGIPWRDGLLGK